MTKRQRSKSAKEARPPKPGVAPILELTVARDDKNLRGFAKALARALVRRELDQTIEKHPTDPALRAEALEVMTVGELARYLGVPVTRLYHHVECGTTPHRRLGEQLLFSRRAVLSWIGDGGEI